MIFFAHPHLSVYFSVVLVFALAIMFAQLTKRYPLIPSTPDASQPQRFPSITYVFGINILSKRSNYSIESQVCNYTFRHALTLMHIQYRFWVKFCSRKLKVFNFQTVDNMLLKFKYTKKISAIFYNIPTQQKMYPF